MAMSTTADPLFPAALPILAIMVDCLDPTKIEKQLRINGVDCSGMTLFLHDTSWTFVETQRL